MRKWYHEWIQPSNKKQRRQAPSNKIPIHNKSTPNASGSIHNTPQYAFHIPFDNHHPRTPLPQKVED